VPVIQIEDLHRSFDGVQVLKGVTCEIRKGEILALIGGSGSGKSVILKHVSGLLRPDRGRVLIDGTDITSLRRAELEQMRSRFGFLFQSGALFSSLNVFDNVAFPLREKTKLEEAKIREKVISVLDQVGLKEAEQKYPAQLSGGMIKRTALARALVRTPEIMFFDEPTTGLDPVIAHTILDLIQSLHRRLLFTGIIVTHELARVFGIVERVALLYEGMIRFIGTPTEIMASQDVVVQQFMSGAKGPVKLY
jgi:phospholipid/cholesterol/gamma-HCH transport system ATP-binding protein